LQNKKIKGYIICESSTRPAEPTIVKSHGVKRVIIKTTLQEADEINRNKRLYPKSVISNGLSTEYIKERIATKTFFGEAGKIALHSRNVMSKSL
jgi:hypothetical protein